VGVPEYQRTVSRYQVQIPTAVGVDQVGPLTRTREDRLSPDGLERPHGAVHAPGQDAPRAIEPVAQLGDAEGAGLADGDDEAPGEGEVAGLGLETGAEALSVAIQKMVSPFCSRLAAASPEMTSPKRL
jgi:hypothetical protein